MNCLFNCWYVFGFIAGGVILFTLFLSWVLTGLDDKDDWADYEELR